MAKTKRKRKKKMGWRGNVMLVASICLAVIFLPTSVMIAVGMLPTLVAWVVDRKEGKLKALTVGAMNLSGCMPFILELWTRGHSFHNAIFFLTQPRTIIVMYFAAAIGYMIEWAVGSITSSIMLERGRKRIKDIEKNHKELESKWGPEVSGRLPLDENGFPLNKDQDSDDTLKAT